MVATGQEQRNTSSAWVFLPSKRQERRLPASSFFSIDDHGHTIVMTYEYCCTEGLSL